jgi:hypothetical protein
MLPVAGLYRAYDRMINEYGALCGMKIGREPKYSEKACLGTVFFTTNPT